LGDAGLVPHSSSYRKQSSKIFLHFFGSSAVGHVSAEEQKEIETDPEAMLAQVEKTTQSKLHLMKEYYNNFLCENCTKVGERVSCEDAKKRYHEIYKSIGVDAWLEHQVFGRRANRRWPGEKCEGEKGFLASF
jgi:hypothetical protein